MTELVNNKGRSIWAEYGSDGFFQWAVKGKVKGRNADLTMIRYIGRNPQILNEQRGWNSVNALMLAAENSNLEVLEYLIEKGAELDLQNTNGNTALILAASSGNLEIVQCLDGNGARIDIANSKGHTAAILATEHGHLSVVQWLLMRYPEQITVMNSYGKNIVIVAAEFGRPEIVKWLREEFSERTLLRNAVLAQTGRGITALMFAAKYKDPSILKYLLELQADAIVVSKGKDTCLMWAAAAGKVEAVNVLLDLPEDERPDVWNRTDEGDTALTRAAENGHMDVIQCLIDHDTYEPIEFIIAMKKAWHQGHVEVATAFMEMLGILDIAVGKVFEEYVVVDLGRKYASESYIKHLEALSYLAGMYNFHFELFLHFIPMFSSPASVLNKLLPLFYKSLALHAKTRDVNLVFKLVHLMAIIRETARIHPLQKIDLGQRIDAIVLMLNECIQSDCMDDETTVQRMLCCSVEVDDDHKFVVENVENAQAFTLGPLVISLDYQESALFCTGHVSTYVDSIFWGYLRHASPTSLFKLSLLTPFGSSWFFNFLYRQMDHNMPNFKSFNSNAIYFRYCPAMMFFGEGISRFLLLLLVAKVSFLMRHDTQLERVDSGSSLNVLVVVWLLTNLLYEYGLVCASTMSLFPNYRRIHWYLQDGWNYNSMAGLGLLIIWFVVIYCKKYDNSTWDIGLGAISVSCLFFAVGMLRYLSLFESVGKLIIMLQAMSEELIVFGVVYGIFLVGFSLTLHCIMDNAHGFASPSVTILTVFSASLGNFDSTFHDLAVGNSYRAIALIIEVFFIIATAVVLLNLIIARMSAVHERINLNSFQHWQFNRALRTKRFLLLEERHPFCMLPAPLNVLPALGFAIHAWWLWDFQRKCKREAGGQTTAISSEYEEEGVYYDGWNNSSANDLNNLPTEPYNIRSHIDENIGKKEAPPPCSTTISICGTIADKTIGVIMAFFAPVYEVFKMMRRIFSRPFRFRRYFRQMSALLLLGIVSYPPYVFFLICEIFEGSTKVQVKLDEGLNFASIDLEFPKQKRYLTIREGAHTTVSHRDYIRIQVLRAELAHVGPYANPIVKMKLGNLQAQTTECIKNAGGVQGTYVWSKQVYCFPIDLQYLDSYQLTFEVCDMGSNRKSADRTIGHFANERFRELYGPNEKKDFTHFSLKDCIANKTFEGRLMLDGDHQPPAAIQVVIESHIHNFLSETILTKTGLDRNESIVRSKIDYSESFLESHVQDHHEKNNIIFSAEDIKRIFSVVNRKKVNNSLVHHHHFTSQKPNSHGMAHHDSASFHQQQGHHAAASGSEHDDDREHGGGDGHHISKATATNTTANSNSNGNSGSTSSSSSTKQKLVNFKSFHQFQNADDQSPANPPHGPETEIQTPRFSSRGISLSIVNKMLHEHQQPGSGNSKSPPLETARHKSRRR